MVNLKNTLLKLNNNLNTLRERGAKYADDIPIALLNQIADHQQTIALTQQTIAGQLPLLNYCVNRNFRRRVGGYIFIHCYLMEYFASLTGKDIERLTGNTAGGL
jgi:hypothetical protein